MATPITSRCMISSGQYQSVTWAVGNGNCSISSRIYLPQRSQMFGRGLPGPSALTLSLPDGSRDGYLAVCCSGQDKQFGGSSRSCSANRYVCHLVGKTMRTGSSSNISQDRYSTRSRARIVRCVGASAGAGAVALKPLLDQVLLWGAVFGVYIAGVASLPRLPQFLPKKWPSSTRYDAATSSKSAKRNPVRKQKPQSTESAGEDGWGLLRSKLSQAVSLDTAVVEQKVVKSPMLGFQAIAMVPGLHLLLTTLEHLRTEAGCGHT